MTNILLVYNIKRLKWKAATPVGTACPGETPQSLATVRLTDRPRKASACNGNLIANSKN